MVTRTVDKWGNSQGIRIPKDLFKTIGIQDPVGQVVEIEAKGDSLIIKKKDTRSELQKRFENFDVEAYFKNHGPREVDWGKPVGREKF